MIKISFTGDIFFGNSLESNPNPFQNLLGQLHNPIINLESVLLPDTYKKEPLKNKVCLKSPNTAIDGIRLLNPRIINLSNNHINDYGNFGVENTISLLTKTGFHSFGAGEKNIDHNIYIDHEIKATFFAYSTRSCDLTGTKLFNEEKDMGPKEFSFELFKKQSKSLSDYKKIILFHWGIEHTHYPMPEQVDIAHKLIDLGVDLVIGNHSHTVQSYEKYKGKWIFYSLGNFFFPDFSFTMNHKTYKSEHAKANRTTIVPTFLFEEKKIQLLNLKGYIRSDNNTLIELRSPPRYTWLLTPKPVIYKFFYKLHLITRFFKKAITFPSRRIKRIFKNQKT